MGPGVQAAGEPVGEGETMAECRGCTAEADAQGAGHLCAGCWDVQARIVEAVGAVYGPARESAKPDFWHSRLLELAGSFGDD